MCNKQVDSTFQKQSLLKLGMAAKIVLPLKKLESSSRWLKLSGMWPKDVNIVDPDETELKEQSDLGTLAQAYLSS